jgi:hypothetical protein
MLDEIFSSTHIYFEMEVFRVGVPFAEVSNTQGLALTRSLNYCPAKKTIFELCSDVEFCIGKQSDVQRHVQELKDGLCHVEFELCIGDK